MKKLLYTALTTDGGTLIAVIKEGANFRDRLVNAIEEHEACKCALYAPVTPETTWISGCEFEATLLEDEETTTRTYYLTQTWIY